MMSFSIVSALALLMTIGQLFLHDGEFRTFHPQYDKPAAIDLLRRSCRMVLEDPNMAIMAPDAMVALVKQGIERQEKKAREAVESQCIKEKVAFEKLNPGEEAPVCDLEKALEAVQSSLPKLATPNGVALEIFKDFSIKDAVELYDYLCSPTPIDTPPAKISVEQVIAEYNVAAKEALAVDLNQFNQPTLNQSSAIYSGDGREMIGELYDKESRRTWVPLSQIPDVVQKAFISAEDKNFFSHKGVELKGILNGFLAYIKESDPSKRKVVGGSTLTQQVVKNLVLNNDITLERKLKEMMIASRLEKLLNKEKILEIYLNLINLGRHSWGIQTATENYFKNKFVSDLTLNEATFFAGITHSPNRYEPELHRERIPERQKFVLKEMIENGYIKPEDAATVNADDLKFSELKVVQSSYYHQSVKADIAKRLDPQDAKQGGLFLFSTQNPSIQRAADRALQERLFQFDLSKGRLKWNGPIGNLLPKEISKMSDEELATFQDPRTWQKKLQRFKSLYSDVHWGLAVVLSVNVKNIYVGVLNPDGSTTTTTLYRQYKTKWGIDAIKSLKAGDVIFVDTTEKVVALRTFPQVQGAAVVMEAKTGKVLALTGGFAYQASEHNRALNSYRQAGSTLKPFLYATALNKGLQPTEVISSGSISFAPIYIPGAKRIRRNMKCNTWTVRNYSNRGAGSMTMRRGLESSNNRVAARLLKIMNHDPEISLELVRESFMDFGIYDSYIGSEECYPIILGAKDTNLVRLAAAYGAIANGGTLVEPHFLDPEKNVGVLKNLPQSKPIYSVDQVSLFQVKSLLVGAVERGTGAVLKEYKGFVAGKTGTSNSFNDAWFMGFSSDIVVGIWIGYDNASKKSEMKLGQGGTGGTISAPVAKEIFTEAFKYYPPTYLLENPPAGVVKVDMGNYIETFRQGYEQRGYGFQEYDRGYGYDEYEPDYDYTEEDNGFIFSDPDSIFNNVPRGSQIDRALRSGQGGLY